MKGYVGQVSEVLSANASVPVGLGCVALLVCRCIHQPRIPWTPYYWNLWRLPHVGVICH